MRRQFFLQELEKRLEDVTKTLGGDPSRSKRSKGSNAKGPAKGSAPPAAVGKTANNANDSSSSSGSDSSDSSSSSSDSDSDSESETSPTKSSGSVKPNPAEGMFQAPGISSSAHQVNNISVRRDLMPSTGATNHHHGHQHHQPQPPHHTSQILQHQQQTQHDSNSSILKSGLPSSHQPHHNSLSDSGSLGSTQPATAAGNTKTKAALKGDHLPCILNPRYKFWCFLILYQLDF